MKIDIAILCHQKDRHTTIEIREVSLFHLLLETLGDYAFGAVNRATFGWTYEVRWGPKDKNFGIADRSIGNLLFTFGQWCADGFGTYRKRRAVASIPVTYAWVQAHYPDAGWPFDGSTEEEDT